MAQRKKTRKPIVKLVKLVPAKPPTVKQLSKWKISALRAIGARNALRESAASEVTAAIIRLETLRADILMGGKTIGDAPKILAQHMKRARILITEGQK